MKRCDVEFVSVRNLLAGKRKESRDKVNDVVLTLEISFLSVSLLQKCPITLFSIIEVQ